MIDSHVHRDVCIHVPALAAAAAPTANSNSSNSSVNTIAVSLKHPSRKTAPTATWHPGGSSAPSGYLERAETALPNSEAYSYSRPGGFSDPSPSRAFFNMFPLRLAPYTAVFPSKHSSKSLLAYFILVWRPCSNGLGSSVGFWLASLGFWDVGALCQHNTDKKALRQLPGKNCAIWGSHEENCRVMCPSSCDPLDHCSPSDFHHDESSHFISPSPEPERTAANTRTHTQSEGMSIFLVLEDWRSEKKSIRPTLSITVLHPNGPSPSTQARQPELYDLGH